VLLACSSAKHQVDANHGTADVASDAGLQPRAAGVDAAAVGEADAAAARNDRAAVGGATAGTTAAGAGASAGEMTGAAVGGGGASAAAAGSVGSHTGAGGGAAGKAAATGDCGDVVAADHPGFAAIKRLATTKSEVRVLVYGQSISLQAWWTKTQEWLQRTYPNGKLIMENHAHGGCSSQCLIGHDAFYLDNSRYNRLPEDVFAWKPDLIIFHVYGDHVDYGYIMQGFTQGCAAFDAYKTYDGKEVPEVHCTDEQRAISADYKTPEVLVQNDFVASDKPVACPQTQSPDNWDCFMNDEIIPENVAKYHYTLQDNFHEWPGYITAQHIDPNTLLMPDMTHLTEPAGTDVMFAMTVPHLCYKP
jgi:hypothetical protein